MKRLAYFFIFILMTTSLVSKSAQAAQDAIITVENAAIREKPDLNSKVIEERSTGEKIRISSFNKNGWFKVKSKLGEFGWIWQADITILKGESEKKAAELELKPPLKDRSLRDFESTWFVRLFGFAFGLASTDLNQRLGQNTARMDWTPGGFLEVGYQIKDRWKLLSRAGFFNSTHTRVVGGTNYDVEHSGLPILFGLQKEIQAGKLWDISAGIYGGISAINRLKITAYDFPERNSSSVQDITYAAMLAFNGTYWLSRSLSLVFELAGYFSQSQRESVSTDFNGAEGLRGVVGDSFTIQVRHIGPMFGVGLQFAL